MTTILEACLAIEPKGYSEAMRRAASETVMLGGFFALDSERGTGEEYRRVLADHREALLELRANGRVVLPAGSTLSWKDGRRLRPRTALGSGLLPR